MDRDSEVRQEIVALLPRLRRFARGLCHNETDADDLVQKALEKALSRLHQFEPGTRLDSWLFRIVQTTFLDDRRLAKRRELTMEAQDIENLPAARADDSAPQAAQRAELDRAMDELPDDQRVVVVSVLVEGYAYREVAEMLDLPIGTVMSRLSRARRQLASRLQEYRHE